MAAVEPLPLLPAMCTAGSPQVGRAQCLQCGLQPVQAQQHAPLANLLQPRQQPQVLGAHDDLARGCGQTPFPSGAAVRKRSMRARVAFSSLRWAM